MKDSLDTPFRLPDDIPTELEAGDQISWDPNTRMIEISRGASDGSRMPIRVHQADGQTLVATVFGDGPHDKLVDLPIGHLQASIELILRVIDCPFKPVLLPQADDRYVFRLE